MPTPTLFADQADVIERIRGAVGRGLRRVILQAPTGAGKGHVIAALVEGAVAKGRRALVIAHTRKIVDQLSRRLTEFGVPHGVLMRGIAPDRAPVQVASRDTLASRSLRNDWLDLPPADLVIVDEAHRSVGEVYQLLLERYRGAVVVGPTATPATSDGRPLAPYWQHMEVTAPVSWYLKEGRLVPVRCYAPRRTLDGKKAKGLAGDPVACWKRWGRGRPTILFSTTHEQLEAVAALFNRSGVVTEVITKDSDDAERDAVIDRVRSGATQVVANCSVFCLDQETEVLTSDGWIGMNDMTYHHEVANWDEGRIFFDEPKEIIRRGRLPDERMVRLSGRRPKMDLRVTDKHRMVYRHEKRCRWRMELAENLIGKKVSFPLCGLAEPHEITVIQDNPPVTPRRLTSAAYAIRRNEGVGSEDSYRIARERLNAKSALRYANPSELTLEECELIGFWIGDGSVSRLMRGGVEYKISQSKDHYPAICDRVEELMRACNLDFVNRPFTASTGTMMNYWSLPRGTGCGPQRRRGVYRIEPYLKKDGTDLFWGLSSDQFTALLTGLWMADGTKHHNNTTLPASFGITSGNRQLLDVLQAVATCRGWSTTILTAKQRQQHHKPLFTMTFRKNRERYCSQQPLKFEEEAWADEMVWCVRSTSGKIVTRRNGTVMVVGNCEGFDMPELSCVILLRMANSRVLFFQILGRVMRSHPSKQDGAVLVDHAGAVVRHGFPDEDCEWSLDGSGGSVDDRYKKARDEGRVRLPVCCPACYAVFSGPACPECGRVLLVKQRALFEPNQDELVAVPREVAEQRQRDFLARAWKRSLAIAAAAGKACRAAAAVFHSTTGLLPLDCALPYVPEPDQWDLPVSEVFPQYARRTKR